MEITSFEELKILVTQHLNGGAVDWTQYGRVRVTGYSRMLLFNYTPEAQFSDDPWNWFERVSRGLIMDENAIVALPFPKFWNWFERGRKTDAPLYEVTSKEDGSLGILWRDSDGRHCVSTRGALFSDQAMWATEYLQNHYDLSALEAQWTLLFEIIYPGNRIVVDYGGREDLILIGAINRFTGDDLWYFPRNGLPGLVDIAHQFGFSLPKYHAFNNVTDILEAAGRIEADQEGWVLRFADGQRFKVKGDRYLELHKLITGTSWKRVWQALKGSVFDTLLSGVPEEFTVQINTWAAEITRAVDSEQERLEKLFKEAPTYSDRRAFAQWATKHHKADSSFLFALLDQRDIRDMVYDRVLEQHRENDNV